MTQMLLYDASSGSVRETSVRVPGDGEVAWVPLIAASTEEIERVLRDVFCCHPLIVEDCVKLNQRPKLDRYDKHLLLTFFEVGHDLSTVEMEHVIGPNYVITVAPQSAGSVEAASRDFHAAPERFMSFSGVILYRLLDRCVDDYAELTDKVENVLDKHERAIFRNPHVKIAGDVFRLKRKLHTVRRIMADEKAALAQLTHQQFPYTRAEADVYFIDIYDHVSRVLDSIDGFRESLSGLLELQLNMKSDRMNEIMKTLTIVSSIFLPLTFVVGLYGMNFHYMPELSWKYGYPAVLVVMLAIAASLWWFYKRKKWL